MERLNISFDKGIHRTPSLGDPAELSECVNLLPQYGELRNIPLPQPVGVELSDNETLLYVHSREGVDAYKNYITKKDDCLYLHGKGILSEVEPLSVTSVGNTLCVATNEGTYYFLYGMMDNGQFGYKNLGNHIPEIAISFGLGGRFGKRVSQFINFQSNAFNLASGVTFTSEESKKMMHENVYANLNEVEDSVKKEGALMYPFFIRYAIKMFDGSHVMQSAPVLMTPNDDGRPVVIVTVVSVGGAFRVCNTVTYAAAKPTLRVISDTSDLSDWTDIIRGVDVFCSSQHQGYKESGSPDEVKETLVSLVSETAADEHNTDKLKRLRGNMALADFEFIDDSDWDGQYPSAGNLNQPSQSSEIGLNLPGSSSMRLAEYPIPAKSQQTWREEIENDSAFYRITTLGISDIAGGKYNSASYISVEDDLIDTIETRESLTEDTNYSHDSIVASKLYAYNSRLMLFDANRMLSNKIDAATFMQRTEGTNVGISMYVVLDRPGTFEGRYSVVKLTSEQRMFLNALNYIYYPDDKARRIVIKYAGSMIDVELRQHQTLNGAYWFDGMKSAQSYLQDTELLAALEEASSRPTIVNQSNRVFVSEVDNPFVFKGSRAVTLQTRVKAISTAAKALSQGQFGSYPLYAFCEDGIWALQVSNEGYISAKQPITRDVIVNDSALCQLDSAVAFVTAEGVKIIEGSSTRCISTPTHGLNFDDNSYLDEMPESHRELVANDRTSFIRDVSGVSFMLYDAAHQILHVMCEDSNEMCAHYVNVLGTDEWTVQRLEEPVKAVVSGYPLSHIQVGNSVSRYSHTDDHDTIRNGYFLTRPCYFGNMLSRKALYDLRVIGQKTSERTKWRVVVLISDTGAKWVRLTSLKARSAKFYRFLVTTELTDIDTVSGMALQYEDRYTAKLR